MLQVIYYLSHIMIKKKSMPQVLTANIPHKLTKSTQGRREPAPRTSRGRGHASTLISIILIFTVEAGKFQALTTVLHLKTHREITNTLFFFFQKSPFMLGSQ